MGNVLQVIKPAPDSHFRLVPCRGCGSCDALYEQYQHPEGPRWRAVCKCCGATADPGHPAPRHEVQLLWNRRNKYDFVL